jgi:micrococcal nuclease
MYEYSAHVESVIDGDTVDLVVDLGFKLYFRERFRLDGIDTAELHAKDPAVRKHAEDAKQLVASLTAGFDFTVRTKKDEKEKYGRYLCTLIRKSDGLNVNEELVKRGLAVAYDGGKRG